MLRLYLLLVLLVFSISGCSLSPKDPVASNHAYESISDPIKISYKDVLKYDGKYVTVETPFAYVFNNRSYLFMSSRSNPHHAHMVPEGEEKSDFFTVRIYLNDLEKFPQDYENQLVNKVAYVTGYLEWYQGDPHILVTDPSQIEIIQ